MWADLLIYFLKLVKNNIKYSQTITEKGRISKLEAASNELMFSLESEYIEDILQESIFKFGFNKEIGYKYKITLSIQETKQVWDYVKTI